jgi:uncharacterized membrane protein
MAFCSRCGTELPAGAGFCPKCGEGQQPAASGALAGSQSGMSENVAALLAYVFGWITGIIFLLIDKRPFVRFHAAQSIVVFGGLHLISIAVAIAFGAGFMMMGGFAGFGLGRALSSLVGLLTFVLWILLMIKAYQHEKFEVPIAAGIAKSLAGPLA